MKKILLILFLAIFVVTVYAQDASTPVIPSFDQLKKNKEKSDQVIQDEKKGVKVATWMNRGKIFSDIYDSNKKGITRGYPELTAKMVLGTDMEETTNDNGEKIWKYERIKLFINNGSLDRWIETEKIIDEPLRESFNAYKKAIELDANGKKVKAITAKISDLLNSVREDGLNYYLTENIESAASAFELSLEISEFKGISIVDSAAIYYGGISFKELEDFDRAIKFFKKCIDIDFHNNIKGTSYKALGECYIEKGDTASAIATLKEGLKTAPENKQIIFDLINIYLSTNQSPDDIFEFIKLAIEKEPENASLYNVQGSLYEQLGNKEEAINSYIKASEVDDTDQNSPYNIGRIYFNDAVALADAAEEIAPDKFKEYNAAKKKADEIFKKGLPYFEKANKLNPEEMEILDILKTLYYRTQMMDKYNEIKTKIDVLKAQ